LTPEPDTLTKNLYKGTRTYSENPPSKLESSGHLTKEQRCSSPDLQYIHDPQPQPPPKTGIVLRFDHIFQVLIYPLLQPMLLSLILEFYGRSKERISFYSPLIRCKSLW
jgi:hypothetical protein